MRKIRLIHMLAALSCFSILVVGCSNSDADSQVSDENVKTIQTFLENEFTGPSDELIYALEQEGAYPPELQEYAEENYKSLVADLEQLVNKNWAMTYLRFAYENGYQLETANIDIQKIDESEEDAYSYEVEVEYNKDGQTKTATVTGRINTNDKGKISTIRNIDDSGLLEKLKQK
jgi:hypothetical protein